MPMIIDEPPAQGPDITPDTNSDSTYTEGGVYDGEDKTRNPFEFDGRGDFSFQLGVSKLRVPPTSIGVDEVYTNSSAAYPIRAKTSTKRNVGQRQKRVTIRLTFPNMTSAWEGENSLRGLVAQFRAAPFLPVYNTYLNKVHNIDALALASMNISTVPGLPYTIAAELICYKFEWRAYVPWYGTFGGNGTEEDPGIIKWPEFQYYYAKARKALDDYAKPPRWSLTSDENGNFYYEDEPSQEIYNWNYQDLPEYDKIYEDALEEKFGPRIEDTTHRMEIYYSDREYSSLMWLNRLGAKKTTDPLSVQVTEWKDAAKRLIEGYLLKWFFDGATGDPLQDAEKTMRDAISGIQGDDKEAELAKQFDAFMAMASLAEYVLMNESDKDSKQKMLDLMEEERARLKAQYPNMPDETIRQIALYRMVSSDLLFAKIVNEENLQRLFRDNGTSWIHEWELPMRRMGLTNEDLWQTVIVDGVTVTTQNAIVSLPLEGRVDAVHQYLGGMGTKATVTMKVVGERAIKHMREVFDKINTSAGNNRDAGVTGFLGIKNDLLSVMGMKYCLLDSWTINTIEGIPHVYEVMMQLSDFDILQQKREMPSAPERLQMMADSTVGHPIMRTHQLFSKSNAYPDLPLPRMQYRVKRLAPTFKLLEQGVKIVESPHAVKGRYLDPDFYFRSVRHDYLSRVDTYDKDGEPVLSPVIDYSKYGVTNLTQKGTDFVVPFSVKMEADGEDPYNVLISASASEFDAADIEVDESNPQSKANRDMTIDVIGALHDIGVSTTELDYAKMYEHGSQFAEASQNVGDSTSPGTIDEQTLASLNALYGNNEADNFRQMIQEDVDGSTEGMIRAFPTYMVYLIDEGGKIIAYKLFDTFYGIQSLISADIMSDKEAPLDTAVLQFSNLYNKLSTPQWYSNYTMPSFLQTIYTSAWTNRQRVYGLVNEMENVQIQAGNRMQIRMGYSANPEALPVVFNGTVTEVTNGAVMTVVVQGDGIELARITGRNFQESASTYSVLGGMMVEPQDLILRYMGVGATIWKQWQSRARIGMNPGDGSSALAHFGGNLWNTEMYGGDAAFMSHVQQVTDRVMGRLEGHLANITGYLDKNQLSSDGTANTESDAGWFNACLEALGGITDNAPDIVREGFRNFQNLSEDFEGLKRNIYPGNGSGYRRFNTGYELVRDPMKQFGTVVWSLLSPSFVDKYAQVMSDTDKGLYNERTFKVNTGGKTNWEIFKMCEALLPNYVLGVRPFEHRSTLFYGKQNWLYTSGVVPVFDAEGLNYEGLRPKLPQAAVIQGDSLVVGPGSEEGWVGHGSGVWLRQDYEAFASSWLVEPDTILKFMDIINDPGLDESRWGEFLAWLDEDNALLADTILMKLTEDSSKTPLYSCYSPAIQNGDVPADIEYMTFLDSNGDDLDDSTGYDRATIDAWNAEVDRRRAEIAVRSHTADNFEQILAFSEITSPETCTWLGTMDRSTEMLIVNAYRYFLTYNYNDTVVSEEEARLARRLEGVDIETSVDYIDLEPYLWSHVRRDTQNQAFNWSDPGPTPSWSTVPLGWPATLRSGAHPHIVDTAKIEQALLNPWNPALTAEFESAPGNETAVTVDRNGQGPDGLPNQTDVKQAFAYLSTFIAGSVDKLLDASYYAQSYTMAQWDALNDSAYYGILAGTEGDNYAGAEELRQGYIDPFTLRTTTGIAGAKILSADVARTRRIQIACDNPFSREFAEPVLEVREPFSRFHYITSEKDIISNGIFKDETNVANQVRAIAHTSSRNNAKREVVVKADASIPSHLVREKIVDTGLNYEMLSWHDVESHKNMARKALKDSLQTMYGGEILIVGNPKMRPFDFMYIWDTPNKMTGWCEINRVTHHIGIDTGFTTSVAVAPIVVVDDSYLFGIMTASHALQLDRVSHELIAQNVATGAMDASNVQANYELESMNEAVQRSLALVDGNGSNYRTMHLLGNIIPAKAAIARAKEYETKMQLLERTANESTWRSKWIQAGLDNAQLAAAIDICKRHVDEEADISNEALEWVIDAGYSQDDPNTAGPRKPVTSIWNTNKYYKTAATEVTSAATDYIPVYTAAKELAELQEYVARANAAVEDAGGVGYINDPASVPTSQGDVAQDAVAFLMEKLEPGLGVKYQVAGGALMGLSAGGGVAAAATTAGAEAGLMGALGLSALATPIVGGPVVVGLLAGLVLFSAGMGIQKFITWLVEQEPISIMLLNQNGYPFQAGLTGADGIIEGQPETLPVISDLTGFSYPADSPQKLWADLGMSLAESRTMMEAETYIRTMMQRKAVSQAGRLETGYVEGLRTNVVRTVHIKSLHDADTVYTAEPIVVEGRSIPKPTAIRLKFIDAPEVKAKEGDTSDMFPGMPPEQAQYGAKEVRDWLALRLHANTDEGTYTNRFAYTKEAKVILNTLQLHDGYGRALGIIVTPDTCPRYNDDAYLSSSQFDWLNESINGQMLTDPQISRWVAPYLVVPGMSQVNGLEADVGDTTGVFHNVDITESDSDQ